MDFGDIFKVPPPKPSTTSGINIHGVDRKRKADQFAAEDDESHTSVGMLFAKPPPPQEPQFSSEAERIQHLVDRLGEEVCCLLCKWIVIVDLSGWRWTT